MKTPLWSRPHIQLIIPIVVALCSPMLSASAATRRLVTSLADSGVGSLRGVITVAGPGDIISFDPGITGTIRLTSGAISIGVNNLFISGPGASTIAISGNTSSNVFRILQGVSVSISDLTIQDGVIRGTSGATGTVGNPGSAGGDAEGGAILNQGTLNLTNCLLRNNMVVGGGGGNGDPPADGGGAQGGAIVNEGTLNLANCVLRNNTAVGGAGGTALVNGSVAGIYDGAQAGGGSGGAIANLGTLNITSCSFSNNSVNGGRGGDAANYAPTTQYPSWRGGHGGAGGGGSIANQGTLILRDCTLRANQAYGGNAGAGRGGQSGGDHSGGKGGVAGGGAITNQNGSLTLTNCTLNDNACLAGNGGDSESPYETGGVGGTATGGAVASQSTLVLIACTVSSNSATAGQGGRSNGTGGDGVGGGISSRDILIMKACTVSSNVVTAGLGMAAGVSGAGSGGSGVGGGIAALSPIQLTNCTLAFNSARGAPNSVLGAGGGGIATSGSLQLTSCTLSSNSVVSGGSSARGGNLWHQGNSFPDPRISNTILVGGMIDGSVGQQDVDGVVSSQGYNLVSVGFEGYGWLPSDLRNMNPLLGRLQDNGGLTFTMALLPGSPAIDAGDDDLLTELKEDQRGASRPLGASVDIGAYEAGGYPVINSNDSGPGSLRQVVQSTHADPIVFAPDITTIVLNGVPITITANQKILASTDGLVLSGNNASRVFNVSISATVTICNVTICNGRVAGAAGNSGTAGQNGEDAMGGGILNHGVLTLINCTLWNNSVIGGQGGNASSGSGGRGGNATGGAAANLGELNLHNCTLATNFVMGGNGGNGAFSGAGGTAYGGGVYNQGEELSLASCTIAGNSAMGGSRPSGGLGAVGRGGGLYLSSGFVFIFANSSIIAGNSIFDGGPFLPGSTRGPDVFGAMATFGYNLVSITNDSTGWDATDLKGSTAAPLNPLLGLLQDNGGPTFTMAPAIGSPAIDNGIRHGGTGADRYTDQRGLPRPVDLPSYPNAVGGDGSDIGAYELQMSEPIQPPGDIVGWWPGNGSGYDVAQRYDALLPTGATGARFDVGRIGQAFRFDGGSNSVQVSGSGRLAGPRTVEAWVYPHTHSGLGMPIVTTGVSGAGDMFGIAGTSGNCNVGRYELYLDHWGTACLDSGLRLTVNAWSHVAFTYDGSVVRFYRDGVPGASFAQILYDTDINSITLGGDRIGGTSTQAALDGLLDEVTIYSRALSPEEIQRIYVSGNEGKSLPWTAPACVPIPSDIIAWWTADGTARDRLGRFNGTWNGTPSYAGGEVGSAFNFSNATQYVQVAGGTAFSAFSGGVTIEAWVKLSRWGGTIISKGLNSSAEYALGVNSTGALALTIPAQPPALPITVSGGLVTSNRWHYVAATYLPTQRVTLFLDGTIVAIQEPLPLAPGPTTASVFIGRSSSGFGPLFGQVDELCLYNRSLGFNEYSAIYAAGTVGKCWRPSLGTRPSQGLGPGIQLFWPTSERFYRLQQTPTLVSGIWSDVVATPVSTNDECQVIVPSGPDKKFFRLLEP